MSKKEAAETQDSGGERKYSPVFQIPPVARIVTATTLDDTPPWQSLLSPLEGGDKELWVVRSWTNKTTPATLFCAPDRHTCSCRKNPSFESTEEPLVFFVTTVQMLPFGIYDTANIYIYTQLPIVPVTRVQHYKFPSTTRKIPTKCHHCCTVNSLGSFDIRSHPHKEKLGWDSLRVPYSELLPRKRTLKPFDGLTNLLTLRIRVRPPKTLRNERGKSQGPIAWVGH